MSEASFRVALQYVRNTNGGATVQNFVSDHSPIGRQLWQELVDANLVHVRADGKIFVVEDCDRFLMFMALLDPECAKQLQSKNQEELLKYFARLAGWEKSRAISAFEVCVVKGFIDRT